MRGRKGWPRQRHVPPRMVQRLLWVLLIGAALGSLAPVIQRWQLEGHPAQVELVADLEGLEQLARMTGAPLAEVVARWQRAGITALALPPYNLTDVGQSGRDFLLFSGSELARWSWLAGGNLDLGGLPVLPHYTYVVFLPHFQPEVVWRDMLSRPWGDRSNGAVLQGEAADGSRVLAFPVGDARLVPQAFLGLSPTGMGLAESLGLRAVPRWTNRAGRAGEAVKELVAAGAVEAGGTPGEGPWGLVIFSGTEALGYPYRLEEMAQALKEARLAVGWVEFARQKGLAHLINLMGGQAVRVHSISAGEMERLHPDAAVRRWLRAVRERGIGALYLRPFLQGAPRRELLTYNEAYVSQLVARLEREGVGIGPARPLGAWQGSLGSLLAAALGVGAGAALLLARLGGWRFPGWLGLMVLGAPLVVLALYLKGYTVFSRQAGAFAATLVFPVLAVVTASSLAGGPRGARSWERILRAWGALLGITALGVVVLVALLADYRFRIGTEQYLGVKAAHALPVLAVACIEFLRRRGGVRGLRRAIREPVRWGHGLALLALALVFLVYVLRTGHDALGVGAWEMRLRLWLEDVFPVRPRTKEIFIGYPALVLAWLGAKLGGRGGLPGTGGPQGESGWRALARKTSWMEGLYGLLLAAGTIAPVSVMNSFAHVHTPLAVSAWRSVLGLGVGLGLGAAAGAGLWWLARRWRGSEMRMSPGVGLPRS